MISLTLSKLTGFAGIAGLSVRELKPTYLYSRWLFGFAVGQQ